MTIVIWAAPSQLNLPQLNSNSLLMVVDQGQWQCSIGLLTFSIFYFCLLASHWVLSSNEKHFQVTLISIVLMHILCNILRIFLGILVVSLVEVQVSCVREFDSYIPSLWIMCLESVAHLLVMLNVSSNFLIYCSVSSPFKAALTKVTTSSLDC